MDSLHLTRCSINTATLGHREPIDVTIDRIAMTRDVFNAAAHAAADSAGGRVAFKTVLDEWVAIVTTKDSTFGMYALHDEIVLVGGPIGTDAETLLTAVIKANK